MASQNQEPPQMDDRLLPEPRPLGPVDFKEEPEEGLGGVLQYEGTYLNPDAAHFGPQTWEVRISSLAEDRRALERFRERLEIWLDATPDTPELDAVMAALGQPAAKRREYDEPVARLLAQTRREEDVGSVVILETELVSHASTVNWGEVRDNLNKGDKRVWIGPDRKWVKMRVEGGSADLRGITSASATVTAVGSSNWEVGQQQCAVVGKSSGLATYRLSAGWKKT